MATPLILMLIGAPTDRKMSDAFLSAMIWNSFFIADIWSPLVAALRSASLIPPQQFVQACLGAGFRIDRLDDHRTVQAVFAVRGGQIPGNHHRAGGNAAVEDFSARAVEDPGALAEEYAHRDHAVFLDDHAFHDLG